MKTKAMKSIMRITSEQIQEVVNKSLLPYNVSSPSIKVQTVTNLPDIDYITSSLHQVFYQNKDKKTKLAFGVSDIKQFSQKIIETFNNDEKECIIENLGVTEQGFLTIKIKEKILKHGPIYPNKQIKTIAVDFSSPNIAKEMHVGHLRSTIFGESMSRILEFQGHNVFRINHIGDWGTQFGMLIAYLKEKFPNFIKEMPNLKDLNTFYKESKAKFESDPTFKQTAQLTVVSLQQGDLECLKAWKFICDISREEFLQIYKRLDITLEEYGESFYNDQIPSVIQDLKQANMLVSDKGAQCVFIEKMKGQPPLFIVKSDGGYGYDSTDMAAIKYRIQVLKCNHLLYITDQGQGSHFNYIIAAAQKIGWHTPPITCCEHMGFGTVQGEDGKRFRSKSGDSVKLKDLLDEAQKRALQKIKDRISGSIIAKEEGDEVGESEKENQGNITFLTESDYLEAAEKMGIAAIKYYDLRQNRISNYTFSYDQMLDTKGNTAVYLLYSYARLCSIIRKSGFTPKQLQDNISTKGFYFTHPQERIIASQLIKFPDIIDSVTEDLAINRLTDYIYDLACKVSEGYREYHINNSKEKESRILLIEATRQVLEKSFYLIGITPLEKI